MDPRNWVPLERQTLGNLPPVRRPTTCLLLAALGACASAQLTFRSDGQLPLYKDRTQPVEARVKDLLSQMTTAEKIAQLRSDADPKVYEPALKTTGFGFFAIYPLRGLTPTELAIKMNDLQKMAATSRLGIPLMPYEEALHGLIDKGHTSFPQAIALAASWDPDYVHQVAQAIADETRAQGVRQVLSPVINVCRDPRWGRMEETYGEDPLMNARMGVAFVTAFENSGVATTPKHFVANLWDGGRDSNSVNISQRQLFDIYLKPFEAVFKEGGSRSVMCSYNAVNGIPCASDPWLLTDLLRKQWGFRGYVVSDWGAASNVLGAFHQAGNAEDAAALNLNAGMDSEAPSVYIFGKPLEDAIRDGKITGATLDESVSRILRVKFELGLFDDNQVDPAKAAALAVSPEHKAVAAESARRAMVLLKNEGNVLPLSKSIKRIAVFGDLASGPVPLGGYSGAPGITKTILQGLKDAAPGTQFDFVEGSAVNSSGMLPAIPATSLSTPDGKPGVKAEYWSNPDMKGSPALSRTDAKINFDWGQGSPDPSLPVDNFSARWTGTINPPKSGAYIISASSDDGMRVFIGGKLIVDNWGDHGASAVTGTVHLTSGTPTEFKVEYFEHGGDAVAKVGWKLAGERDVLGEKVRAASSAADASVIFVGIREGEGQDRAFLKLPGNQEGVIAAAAESGKPVVVVLVAGSAVTMEGWIDKVPAILDAWYPGEEGADAIAATLFGDNNPGGKLPMTFPKTVGQCPLYYNFEPSGRGYDYVDIPGKPLFPFGYGLSYTNFTYSNLVTKGEANQVTVTCDVENTGARAGDEVVQLYTHQEVSSVIAPVKQLNGFRRISLKPGEKKTVTFNLGFDQLSMWNAKMQRVVEPGEFQIMIGSSSDDIRLKKLIQVRSLQPATQTK